MNHLKLSVVRRSEFGRGMMKRLRKSGNVPAIVYGHSGTTPLTVSDRDLRDLLKKKGQSAALVDISIDGNETLLSDIADIQRDPVTDKFLHIDFHEVLQTEKMTTIVPLKFSGESVGVKVKGGILDIARHEVSVRCFPADLPALIGVDVSALDIGDIIHLGNLQIPSGVELLGDHSTTVVACKAIAAEQESAEAAAPGVEGAEQVSKAEPDKEEAGKQVQPKP
ncbi:MAG: 50S ribosomal protein L25 [Puniceicoccales bacterium]|nr:50S ribosomal protein L25 [Puniceicoccales bacterium]